MTRKLSMFFFLVLFTQFFLVAQQKMILRPDNTLEKVTKSSNGREVMRAQPSKHAVQNNAIKSLTFAKSVNGLIDTLVQTPPEWDSNFGTFGQDWLMQWFQAPADLTIKAIGFSTYDPSSPNVEVKIVKVNWTKDQLDAAGEKNWGYYPATGNGFNDITAFPSNPDATPLGEWHAVEVGSTSPFAAADIWGDDGSGNPVASGPKLASNKFYWTPMDLMPSLNTNILKGEIFGIALKNTNTNLTSDADADRFGVWGGSTAIANGWKFYANGRNVVGPTGDIGWWSRKFAWDFAAVVEITGDIPPEIVSFTKIPTNLSTGTQTVTATITDVNPGGGASGVQTAILQYKVGAATTYTDVTMTAGANDTYTADIPGQAKGSSITYKIVATDVNNLTSETGTVTYTVFNPTKPTLFVFNGYNAVTGNPSYYQVIALDRDKWGYGALTKELVDHYINIFEVTTDGPSEINNDVIKEWLAASPTHNYLLCGDEWLGNQSDWTNKTYVAGDFQYDILGIAKDYNDVSVVGTATAAMVTAPSFAKAIAGTTIGDSLYLKTVANNDQDSLLINPYYEVGIQNWLDGFDPVEGTTVDMTAKGLDGNTYNVGVHRTLAAGNKIVFLSFDPLSLDSRPPYTRADYFWYGYDHSSPIVQAIRWFGADNVAPTVEFKCNMSVLVKRGKFPATGGKVWVRGNFNDWAGKDYELTDADNDSVFTGTFSNFTVGQDLVFKFVRSDPETWERNPNEGGGIGNRPYTVVSGANVYQDYWEGDSVYVPVPTKQINLTFTINMELERLSGLYNPEVDTVSVRGTMNGWGQTKMISSALDSDLYEVVIPYVAALDEKISFKYFYGAGTWEVNNLTDNTQNDRYFVVSQTVFDAGENVYEAVGFNNGSLETVLNQDAYITFTCNTDGASIIDAPAGTPFTTVYMCGGNSPLQWPTGGWSDAEINLAIQLFDDGTHNDASPGDKIFTTEIKFPQYATLNVVYKYGANWGLSTNGGVNDNEAGVGADKTLKMLKTTAQAVVVDSFGVVKVHDLAHPDAINKEGTEIPTVFALAQNFPNPFNPETSIRFSVPQESFVTVKVFNTLGEEVMTLVNEAKTAGTYNVSFNAKNLTSGIYFYSIKANDFTSTKKMILMK